MIWHNFQSIVTDLASILNDLWTQQKHVAGLVLFCFDDLDVIIEVVRSAGTVVKGGVVTGVSEKDGMKIFEQLFVETRRRRRILRIDELEVEADRANLLITFAVDRRTS